MTSVSSSDVSLDWTAGDLAVIRQLAAALKRETPQETLLAIHAYLKNSLKMIEPATWDHICRGQKTSVEILCDGAWGCSAHAQVACHLARACGIPAILVKSLNVNWVETGNRGDGRGEGHVYVEVLVAGMIHLWDAQGGELYGDSYNYQSDRFRDRLIYEKGSADSIILSHHGTMWEAETQRLFPRVRADRV